VNVADGGEWDKAQDDNDLRGKILRMDLDGSIPWDNPNPGSFVYAKGFRKAQSEKSVIFKIFIHRTKHFHRVCKINYHKVIQH
jgi:hypothetical protein